MPFGKELSHLVAEQISRAVERKNIFTEAGATAARSGIDEGRIVQLEANVQRLAENFTSYLRTQKNSKRNIVDYGLNVIALQGLRLAVTSGRAIFIEKEEPLDLSYTYLQLANAGTERQIRYIYLESNGILLESSTDPTNMGKGYLPLAMVDVWAGTVEINQDKITDLRPRAGSEDSNSGNSDYELCGNVTLESPDTGNDSFVVSATSPASLKVDVTSGRALVDAEIVDAQGGLLDLTNHSCIVKEFVAFSDGATKTFNLYHKNISSAVIYVDDAPAAITVDADNGTITFDTAPAQGATIAASYTFGGNYLLVFLVEKTQASNGKPFGVIGWKVGSNRNSSLPPELGVHQHAIAKIDMSGSITAITDALIDNSYEVQNLTQYDLQYGGSLGEASLKASAVTADKIAVGSIDAAKIITGAIQAQHIAAGAIQASHIAADAISADMVKAGTISADKFESTTWGDMSQAMRYVKSIVGGAQTWKKALTLTDLSTGIKANVGTFFGNIPALMLDTQHHWDDGFTWDANGQKWDIPVAASGYWEGASMDYGTVSALQTEFWGQLLTSDPAVTITVKTRYSDDNVTWTDYETLAASTASGYNYWVGSLQTFRYFKVRVEFATSDTSKKTIIGYPEIRAANCQLGTEDIYDSAVTTAKLLNGAVTAVKLSAGALSNNISVITGTIINGAALPLPAGYTKDQCKWLVCHDRCIFSNTGATTGIPAEVIVNPATLVANSYWRNNGGSSDTLSSCQATATVAYIVIGIK